MPQKITPFLWFDDQAEAAMNLYVSVFKNSRILSVDRYPEGGMGKAGTVMTSTFEIEGIRFMALNGGPHYSINGGVSFFVDCETQMEVDEIWEKLLAGGGEALRCGWLKDRFGVHWQIIPKALGELMGDPDPAKSRRVVQAMLGMVKLDIEGLKRAHRGE